MMRSRTAIAIFILSVIFLPRSVGQSIVQVFPLPNTTYWTQAYGLAADSARLYVSSGTSSAVYNRGFIYALDYSAHPVDSIPTGIQTYSQGLAWDGSNYWYVKGSGSSVRIYKVSVAGALTDSIVPPSGWYLGGACWDGTGLWISNYYPNNLAALYKYDVVTKTIVDTIHTYGLQPQGIAWDGTYLYYVMDNNDADAEKIFQVDVTIRDTVKSWALPEGPTSNMSPRGLAWDGQFLWMIAEPVGASSGRSLYKYDLSGSGTPDINLPVTLVDFGQIRIGQSRQIDVAIQNVGTAPLRLDSVVISLSSDFTTTISTPHEIQANSTISMPLLFAPAQFGSDTANVAIYSDDPDEAVKRLPLKGFGIYASSILSVLQSYDYGAKRVGSSNSWHMNLQNLGGDPLSISSIVVSDPAFWIDSVGYPIILDSLETASLRVWFSPPSAGAYLDTLKITSDASNGPVTNVVLQGSGNSTPIPIGSTLWTYTVPNHPISNTDRLVKAVRAIGDITGDGTPDVVVSTANYWTMALNGNASGGNDSLWAFTSYISSFSAGSIGTTGDYSHQKALGVASDLNGDGVKDVVIGTGGGNEHVYALNGWNGNVLWTFGTDAVDSFGLGDFTGVDVSTDFDGDNVPDVIAAASATETGGVGGRRSVYLFNGASGQVLWQSPLPGFTHGVAAVGDISGDGVPDVIGAVGEPAYKASAYSGVNGALLWDFSVPSSTGGGKEVMAFPVSGQTPDIILGAFWGPVYRIEGESGTEIWNQSTGGSGVMQLGRLKDVTGDGIDEVVVALLVGGARCLNGANGQVVWSLPTGNTMGVSTIPDLNDDGYDDVVFAVQNQGVLVVKGQDGQQLGLYTGFGSNQTREVATLPDIDGNNSREIIAGSQQGNIAVISGGLDAGSTGVLNVSYLPQEFSVSQNYPNPFNPSTTFRINLPAQSDVTLTVYDMVGRKVKDFVYQRVPAGTHEVVWDGRNASGASVASGVYFYKVTSGQRTISNRMLLLK